MAEASHLLRMSADAQCMMGNELTRLPWLRERCFGGNADLLAPLCVSIACWGLLQCSVCERLL